jgi:hypothetical protein
MQRSVWAVGVVVLDELGQHLRQVAWSGDQQVVEAFAAQRLDLAQRPGKELVEPVRWGSVSPSATLHQAFPIRSSVMCGWAGGCEGDVRSERSKDIRTASHCARCRPRPRAFSTAHRRTSNRATQRASWRYPARVASICRVASTRWLPGSSACSVGPLVRINSDDDHERPPVRQHGERDRGRHADSSAR